MCFQVFALPVPPSPLPRYSGQDAQHEASGAACSHVGHVWAWAFTASSTIPRGHLPLTCDLSCRSPYLVSPYLRTSSVTINFTYFYLYLFSCFPICLVACISTHHSLFLFPFIANLSLFLPPSLPLLYSSFLCTVFNIPFPWIKSYSPSASSPLSLPSFIPAFIHFCTDSLKKHRRGRKKMVCLKKRLFVDESKLFMMTRHEWEMMVLHLCVKKLIHTPPTFIIYHRYYTTMG